MVLPNLLLQIAEQFVFKEFCNGDVQTVAQFFDGGDGGAVIPSAGDIVDGGLRNTAERSQLIDGDAMDAAKLQYAEFYCGSYRHFIYPDLNELIQEYPF